MTENADTFPAPTRHSTGGGIRTTAPLVGGARPITPGEAARVFPDRIPHPQIDRNLTAATQRGVEQFFPRTVKLAGTATAVDGDTTVILLGGPTAGFTWNLRRLNVGPVDYAAGSFPAGVYVVAVITGQATPTTDSAGQVISTTTAYPAEGTWGHQEVTLQAGDTLAVLLVGLATGVEVTAGGQAIETAAGVDERRAL